MHEVGLMAEALRLAAQTAERAGAQRIERLTFTIAPGGHVTPAAVQTLFAMMSPGTLAEGAELAIEWQELQQYCWDCAASYRTTAANPSCPSCGHQGTPETVVSELTLKSIDVIAAGCGPDEPAIRPAGGSSFDRLTMNAEYRSS